MQKTTDKDTVNTRQICFFLAFLLPVSKILELPSELSAISGNDLLLPVILHNVLQAVIIILLYFGLTKTDKPLFDLMKEKFGKVGTTVICIVFSAFYLLFSLVPVLRLERFVEVTFFDTAPSLSVFLPFFLLVAYISVKPLKYIGRCADVAFPLFITAFVGLMAMSVSTADFSELLPLFSKPVKTNLTAFIRSCPNFSDTALILPLFSHYSSKNGDLKKIMCSYGGGSVAVWLFLAVFYGIFGSIAPLQPFAFDRVAQFFGALSVIGRIDLLLVYIMTVLLLFYYSLPIQLCVHCFAKATNINKIIISAVVCIALSFYAVFCKKFFMSINGFIIKYLFWIFPIFSIVMPIFFFFVFRKNKEKKYEK